MRSGEQRLAAKSIGRFYTNPPIAAFVTEMVLKHPRQTVLDPSCGNGVFLIQAVNRLRSLGSDKGSSLTGIDMDEGARSEATSVNGRLQDWAYLSGSEEIMKTLPKDIEGDGTSTSSANGTKSEQA